MKPEANTEKNEKNLTNKEYRSVSVQSFQQRYTLLKHGTGLTFQCRFGVKLLILYTLSSAFWSQYVRKLSFAVVCLRASCAF